MEQQVHEAALAMVRATTDRSTRSAASNFLEQWTRTPESWEVYVKWLRSFDLGGTRQSGAPRVPPPDEALGTQLLCLTLLVAKIRREVTRQNPPPAADNIRNEIWSLLSRQQQQQQSSCSSSSSSSRDHSTSGAASPLLVGALCGCMAALTARDGHLAELVQTCCGGGPSILSLRLLTNIPPEVEACGELATSEVTAELWPHFEKVLDTVRRALVANDEQTAKPAMEALSNWAKTCHVSLSHLNSPTCNGTEKLLPVLVDTLSRPQPEELLVSASRALTEAILVPADSCTPTRQQAVESMIRAATTSGFIATPFAHCTAERLDDGAHALASLICSIVTEEVDELCQQPAEPLLSLLLQIQTHPHIPVSLTVLECWLTVQEVPTSERHEHWRAPLFLKVSESLVRRVSYSSAFTTWQEELDMDEQQFSELRRMVTDVLVSCYFLLRVQFLQQMTAAIEAAVPNNDWALIESALYCLGCVAREVCARIKARATSRSLMADRDATAQRLLQLVDQLVGHDPKAAAESAARQHSLVLGAVSNFIGSYSPAWNVHCSYEAIGQLLGYLRVALAVPAVLDEVGKATRAIYVGCATKLLNGNVQNCIQHVRATMEVALATGHEPTMTAIGEGSTRLIVLMKDEGQLLQALKGLMEPLLQRIDQALAATGSPEVGQKQLAFDALSKYLLVLQAIIRFSDATNGVSPLHQIVPSIWPFLDRLVAQIGRNEPILNEVLAIHQQILSNSSDLVAPRFSETVKFVVDTFESTKLPRTLDYLAAAVETFSPINEGNVQSFNQLLAHVSRVLYSYLTTEKRPDECTQLVRAYFEMNQRYVLFCPLALVDCPEFENIVSLALECLTACKGERESTRATLNFLGQLFGWRTIRLSDKAVAAFRSISTKVDDQLAKQGEAVTRACIGGLAGNSPQMLWPSLSDCVFAIVATVVGMNAMSPVVEETTAAHQWVYNALCTCQTSSGKPIPPATCQRLTGCLCTLGRLGPKGKAKGKILLTDVAKMCKGEMDMNEETMLAYST